MEVTVAAYGPGASEIYGPGVFEGPPFDSEGDGVAWDDRQTVTLEVDQSETLAGVIDRAAAEFGVRTTPPGAVRSGPASPVSSVIAGVAFYKESDDLPGAQVGPWRSVFACVDAEGELSWKWTSEAEYGDLMRAHERRLLPGDPRRPYLWPIYPQGGEELFGSWPDLIDVAGTALRAAEAMAAVYGAAEFIQAVTRRLRRAARIDHTHLEAHNAGPAQLQELLKFRRPTVAEVATLFALSQEQAEDLLDAFGLAVAEDGRTIAPETLDAKFERRLMELAIRTSEGFRPHDEGLEAFTRARLEALAQEQDESVVIWSGEWHEAAGNGFNQPSQLGEQEQASEEAEGELGRPDFRVLAIRTDDGIDPADLEEQLNRAAEDGFFVMETIYDQPLRGGQKGHIFLLVRRLSES